MVEVPAMHNTQKMLKPESVDDYNHCMNGVSTRDLRKSRWVIFFWVTSRYRIKLFTTDPSSKYKNSFLHHLQVHSFLHHDTTLITDHYDPESGDRVF